MCIFIIVSLKHILKTGWVLNLCVFYIQIGLKINVEKTEYMLLARQQNVGQIGT
jgi:hypothetical protein